MSKFFVIAVLCGSLLALGPQTRLPLHYDDMLFNNLPVEGVKDDGDATTETWNIPSTPLFFLKPVVLKTFYEHADPISRLRGTVKLLTVMSKFRLQAKQGDSHHALFFIEREGVRKTYELTLVREEKTFQGVLTRRTESIPEETPEGFHFQTAVSELAFPFTDEKVLASTTVTTPHQIFNIRNKILDYIRRRRGSQKAVLELAASEKFDPVKAATDATNIVNSIADSWTKVANAFKTTRTKTIDKIIEGKGFRSWKTKSRFLRHLGVPSGSFERYKKGFKTLTRLDQIKNQRELDAFLDMADFIPDNRWGENDFAFGNGKNNAANSAVAISKSDLMTGTFNVICVTTEGAFKLSPNSMIITNNLSVAGGIYESKVQKMVETPREVGPKEAKALSALSLLNGMQLFATAFGVKFNLPDSPNQL